ncbi:MAG TPA: ANTAR domain-containing protein [Amycolatopsis sp.]|nr:ANTAR domain-containing protein [Amycolatopsis sp.]
MSILESGDRDATHSGRDLQWALDNLDDELGGLVEALALENEQLHLALKSRVVIGQATGVLMCQRQCGPDEAFSLLTKLSQDTNTKLREVAKAFLDEFLSAQQAPLHDGRLGAGR